MKLEVRMWFDIFNDLYFCYLTQTWFFYKKYYYSFNKYLDNKI